MNDKERCGIGLLLLLSVYVFSYVALSSFGAYAPATIGLAGVKSWAWVPAGFYVPTSGGWVRTPLRIFYAPLSIADHRLWHNHWYPEEGDPVYREK
jgi:hypothetical protein